MAGYKKRSKAPRTWSPAYTLPGTKAEAYVAKFEDGRAYSRYVADHLIPSMKTSLPKRSKTEKARLLIVATCVLSPSVFYEDIKRDMVARAKVLKEEKKAEEEISAFEKACESFDPNASSLSDLNAAHQSLKKRFRVSIKDGPWPHFDALRELGENVIRLCTICDGHGFMFNAHEMSNREAGLALYHKSFQNMKPAMIAFFLWLNEGCRCFVLQPWCWQEWGILQPRDFALLNDKALIEFHEKQKVFVYTEDLQNWGFIHHPSLRSKLEDVFDAEWKKPAGCLDPQEFLCQALSPPDIRTSLLCEIDSMDEIVRRNYAPSDSILTFGKHVNKLKTYIPQADSASLSKIQTTLAKFKERSWDALTAAAFEGLIAALGEVS